MKITRLAVISLTAVLAFGCRYSSPSDDNDDGGSTQPPAETYPIEGVNWEITTVAKAAILPDVYFFESSLLTIYSDDDNDGTYTYSTTGYTATATTIKFDDIDGTYTVDADGALTIIYTEDGEEIQVEGTTVIDPDTLAAIDNAEPGENVLNKLVQIRDTTTSDSGELRLKFSDSAVSLNPIETGKVTANLVFQENEDFGGGDKITDKTYFTLYSDGTSNANIHGEVVLQLNSDNPTKLDTFYRSGTYSEEDKKFPIVEDSLATFEVGEELAVELSWGLTNYTVTINGEDLGTFDSPEQKAVQVVSIKMGDTSAVSAYELLVNDLVLYDNSVEVFEDEFETYAAGSTPVPPYNASATAEATVIAEGDDSAPTCEEGYEGTPPDCTPIEVGDGPAPLNEFKFSGVDYSNTGTNTNYAVGTSGSTTYTATSGAMDVADTAMNMDQDAGFGYMSYTSDETAGAAEITGSFSVETVIKQSSRAVANDVALVDYADTKAYLGFKTYIEKDDNSFKFKVYGGQVDDGNGGTTNLSTEAVTDPIATETWHHILAIYDAESLDGGDYGQLTVYINGEVAVQKDVDFELAKNVATDKFILMGGASSSDKNFDGDVDNVAVWNEALSAANVAERVAMFSTSADEELTPLSEFTFSGVDYSNTGTNTNYAVGTSGSTAYTATSGATDAADTAMNMDQDAGFGYMSYTSDATAGAAEITGSFSVETVINQSSRAVANDVALVDYADTKAYLGFKTYIEKDDNSFKFKVYGGQVDDGNGGTTNLSTEAVTDPIATETWHHILAVYDAESLNGGDYGQLTVYVNGDVAVQKDVDFELAKNVATDKFILMGGASSSDKNFDGDVDNVAVWNEALTAANATERAALFGF